MPSVRELSAPYGNFMFGPRRGRDVCEVCLNLTDGYARCYACDHVEQHLDAVLPISYSVATGQLHHTLRGYKRFDGYAGRMLAYGLAAVLWRFLDAHERCVAAAAGVESFDLVTTVPSGDRGRDAAGPHALARLVGEVVGPTRERFERVLTRTQEDVPGRTFSARKFAPVEGAELPGLRVLLIDDTWTSGASAQSAAAALRAAGAATVAAVVIGRHINPEWHDNRRRLAAMPTPFDWKACAFCAD